MSNQYAESFHEIPTVLATNHNLRQLIISLIKNEPIPAKVLEDSNGSRLEVFRVILTDLTNGEIDLVQAFQQTYEKLPRQTSPHSSNNRVFPRRWSERLVKTQFSRFYNQAVLEQLHSEGVHICVVPHSDEENTSSACTQQLAGKQHSVTMLYTRLLDNYQKGNWTREVKIPDHPHCTHVIKPLTGND